MRKMHICTSSPRFLEYNNRLHNRTTGGWAEIPAGQIWAGNLAKFLRELKGDERAFIPKSADHYSELAATHAAVNAKKFHDLTTVPEVKPEEKSRGVKTHEKSLEVKTEAV